MADDDYLFDGITLPDDPIMAELFKRRVREVFAEYMKIVVPMIQKNIYESGTGGEGLNKLLK